MVRRMGSTSPAPEEKSRLKMSVLEILFPAVVFPPNSAELTPEAVLILDRFALALLDRPDLTRIEASGHSRPLVERDALALSRARAKHAVAELVAQGVAKERLMVGAYAAHCPLAPEEDQDSRNGRVEFKLVATDTGPTDYRRGCDAADDAGLSPPEK